VERSKRTLAPPTYFQRVKTQPPGSTPLPLRITSAPIYHVSLSPRVAPTLSLTPLVAESVRAVCKTDRHIAMRCSNRWRFQVRAGRGLQNPHHPQISPYITHRCSVRQNFLAVNYHRHDSSSFINYTLSSFWALFFSFRLVEWLPMGDWEAYWVMGTQEDRMTQCSVFGNVSYSDLFYSNNCSSHPRH